jgi:hypothetical protein
VDVSKEMMREGLLGDSEGRQKRRMEGEIRRGKENKKWRNDGEYNGRYYKF